MFFGMTFNQINHCVCVCGGGESVVVLPLFNSSDNQLNWKSAPLLFESVLIFLESE